MKRFTYEDIKSWNPCYSPSIYLSKNWTGTIIDILNMDNVPFEDRLWVVLRTELISEKVMRLFAVWSYRQTLTFVSNQDPRSINAANIAEQYALGNASKEDLEAAWSAARSAARSAADAAARSAADAAARSAADAAWSAARSAARSAAAWSAARSAARSAAYSAARSAADAAWSAARSAADAAWSAQKEKLIEMIIGDEK